MNLKELHYDINCTHFKIYQIRNSVSINIKSHIFLTSPKYTSPKNQSNEKLNWTKDHTGRVKSVTSLLSMPKNFFTQVLVMSPYHADEYGQWQSI
jgi:hypothetical protein